MGSDPKNSVVDDKCRTWDVKILLVTDGGPFDSNADKNPTLSIMALAWRSMDSLMDSMRKGKI
ncbi:MAG: family oxidoreductase [Verrucomicrobiales bacterium]|nr:family oxidoreductase [Verrucomicrobiales bacterium]